MTDFVKMFPIFMVVFCVCVCVTALTEWRCLCDSMIAIGLGLLSKTEVKSFNNLSAFFLILVLSCILVEQ